MKRVFMTILITLATMIVVIICGVAIFLQTPAFGGKMRGERLERALRSPNYRNGQFHNLGSVVMRMDTVSAFRAMQNHTNKKDNATEDRIDEKISSRNTEDAPIQNNIVPKDGEIPVVRQNLHELDRKQDAIVWFGHSSYLLQVDGVRFLIDPVFYVASPVRFVNRPFPGINVFSPDDIPEVDYLVITHDHWDHLDHRTVKELSPKIGRVICPLGVGAHFERWGYAADRLIELDWNEEAVLDTNPYSAFPTRTSAIPRKNVAIEVSENLSPHTNTSGPDCNEEMKVSVECLPSQHFSGRGLHRNATLWASYMLHTPAGCIYISGDGGYGPHFKTIGKKYPDIRLAILENGQYNELWRPIHIMPDAMPHVIEDLGYPRSIITVHHSKYALARHPWDEPRRTEDIIESTLSDAGCSLIRLQIGKITSLSM